MQDSDIAGKNQTQQSPFTKPYRLLTFMGGLSNYIIIFLSDCHILCNYKILSELHIKFLLANAGHSKNFAVSDVSFAAINSFLICKNRFSFSW